MFVVLLALAVGANSSVIPLSALGGVVVAGAPPAAIAIQTVPAGPVQVVSGPLGVQVIGGVVPQVVTVPQVVSVAAAVPSAVSVSQTRGAVHVAPLPGHATSVTQQNLQPAPGTL